jgi:hypothetical protein
MRVIRSERCVAMMGAGGNNMHMLKIAVVVGALSITTLAAGCGGHRRGAYNCDDVAKGAHAAAPAAAPSAAPAAPAAPVEPAPAAPVEPAPSPN